MLSDNFLSESGILFDRLDDIVGHLKRAGGDQAEASISEHVAFETNCRNGKIINTHHAEHCILGMRVFIGKRKADLSISFAQLKNVDVLADRVVAMAKVAPEDPYCGLAENSISRSETKAVEIYDAVLPDMRALETNALEAESAALAHKGITNSEGSEAGWELSQSVHFTSKGFQGIERETTHYLSCVVLAQKNGAMERDYESHLAHFGEDIPPPKNIGDIAATRTLARLGATKPKSCRVPVVYHPRVARSLLGHLAGAISGGSVARGASFLKDRLGAQVFPESISIIDDPFRARGLRTQAFDDEGVAATKRNLVDAGVLTGWLLDWPSARQLGMESTGHAGGATNLWLAPSQQSREALVADIANGLYITELIGSGTNLITGDYSRGCSGFWIHQGKISHPVHEITISGNLEEIFAALTVANDLTFRYGIDTPTLRIAEMTLAGA